MLKTMLTRWLLAAALVTAALTSAAAPARAQDYPTKPIQVIVPFAAGSASDVVVRVMLNKMSELLGQTFVVENRPGAGGNTGTAVATRATPDGYTLVMSTSGPLAANVTLFKELGYDPQKDLTPISLFAVLPNVIVINAKLPPKTLTEFIAYAKEHPGINYGSVGVGSSQHLAAAYFEQIAGVTLTHVPYRNISGYAPDFIAGRVPLGFQFLPNVLGLIKNGDARTLAVTSHDRMTALPDVPTAAEAGVANYETFGWLALLAPPKTPRPIVDKIYQAMATAVKDPTVRARFVELGAEPVSPGPEKLAEFIVSETVKWRDIIKKAGIEPM